MPPIDYWSTHWMDVVYDIGPGRKLDYLPDHKLPVVANWIRIPEQDDHLLLYPHESFFWQGYFQSYDHSDNCIFALLSHPDDPRATLCFELNDEEKRRFTERRRANHRRATLSAVWNYFMPECEPANLFLEDPDEVDH